jgi:hypothetical protein
MAVEFWQKRTALDPSLAEMVQEEHQKDARKIIERHRAEMKEIHPNLDRYRYDFSGLEARMLEETEETAVVGLEGRVKLFNPDGMLLDEDLIEDRIKLVRRCRFANIKCEWSVDYEWALTKPDK